MTFPLAGSSANGQPGVVPKVTARCGDADDSEVSIVIATADLAGAEVVQVMGDGPTMVVVPAADGTAVNEEDSVVVQVRLVHPFSFAT